MGIVQFICIATRTVYLIMFSRARWIPITSDASRSAEFETIIDQVVAILDKTMTDRDHLISAFVMAVYSLISSVNVISWLVTELRNLPMWKLNSLAVWNVLSPTCNPFGGHLVSVNDSNPESGLSRIQIIPKI